MVVIGFGVFYLGLLASVYESALYLWDRTPLPQEATE